LELERGEGGSAEEVTDGRGAIDWEDSLREVRSEKVGAKNQDPQKR